MALRKFLLLTLVVISSSCFFEESEEYAVVTEDVMYVSSETVRLQGRIVSNPNVVTQHGFEIAQSSDFSAPQLVNLDAKDDLGPFIGELTGLSPSVTYFYRAFVQGGEVIEYGETREFQTLEPSFISFAPQIAAVGEEVIINSQNLSSSTRVFFGNTEATIVEEKFESFVSVEVPSVGSQFRVPIRIISNEQEYLLDTFEYVTGVWFDENLEFPLEEINLFETVSIQSENFYIFGLGYDQIGNALTSLWFLNFDSWSWGFLGSGFSEVRSPFSEGNIFGGGLVGVIFGEAVPFDQMWRIRTLDGGGETFENFGTFPFLVYKGTLSSIGDDLYVYGGQSNQSNLNQTVYRYRDDEWTEVGRLPIVPSVEGAVTLDNAVTSDIPNFTIQDRAFILYNGVIWEFDPVSIRYIEHDQVPLDNCFQGAYQVLDDKVYFGLCGGSGRDFYEYDPINKIFKEKNRSPFNRNGYNAGTFVFDGRIYFMINPQSSARNISGPIGLFSLDPNAF